MRLVIVTGMSGAGKSTAMKMLEDAQYFCVDNLPIQLVGKFVSLVSANKGEMRIPARGSGSAVLHRRWRCIGHGLFLMPDPAS